eukprot:c25722_g1_i1.p1 GENE.c25722_g1_i1~~c25722_g1_i1.p1  ORF type:complete len:539 (+),score=112.87 c25722_g1_i1:35-1651(+)
MKLSEALLGLLALTTAANSLRILNHNGANLIISSPKFNRHLGKQSFRPLTAPGVFLGHKNVCGLPKAELESLCQGSVAIFIRSRWDFWDFETERKNLDCVQQAGAVGMVVAYGYYYEPGLGFRVWSRSTKNRQSSIPLLHIVTHDLPKDLLQTIGNSTITVELSETPNKYEDLWRGKAFFTLWQLVLSILNGFGALLGMSALLLLLMNIYSVDGYDRRSRWESSLWLLIGYSIMTVMCIIRFVYCATGPFYSSFLPGFTMDYHLLVLNFTPLFETIATMIAIALFRRWAQFGMTQRLMIIHKVLAVLALGSMCVCLTVVIVHIVHGADVMYLAKIVKPALLVALSSIVSLVSVQRLVTFVIPQAVEKQRRNLQYSGKLARISVLMLSAAAMNTIVLAVVIIVLAVQKHLMWSLHGHFVTYSIVFTAVTIQALCHMFALFPSTRNFRNSRFFSGTMFVQRISLTREKSRTKQLPARELTNKEPHSPASKPIALISQTSAHVAFVASDTEEASEVYQYRISNDNLNLPEIDVVPIDQLVI